ncbi:MarR family winged helix-turn-helix transcriptional regulator [Neptunicoccus sediminis]|uniref:MarR family winged helix-turn-helix transcriptional regulator n=1 Tax=Neptunicoccus sediminis TaxID=1892596 RepID=UPI0008460AAE|nr:MarR family transcriptional regulator [Neptunicoccus sediminis]
MSKPFDLHDGLGYRLTIAARSNNASFDADLSQIGLTRQMWCVLIAVGEQGITTPSGIADYIGIIRPATSRTLKQMEKNGLLRRVSGTTDKRTTTVELTAEGQDSLALSLPFAQKQRDHVEKCLSPEEQVTLSALLQKLTQTATSTASGV